ncbi:MAG: YggS family pyridoxal phosphate-dependent enzyme [Acidobacteriota bacterium]
MEAVRRALGAAVAAAGRPPGSVHLMAAVKTRPASDVTAAADLGLRLFGENRVQEGEARWAELPPGLRNRVRVHFIGRLQTNKARRALRLFDSLDGVDSVELARRLSRIAVEEGFLREVMIEVNLGEESQKGGVPPEDARALACEILGLPGLRLTGVMGVPPLSEDPEAGRPHFRRLAEIFLHVRSFHPEPEAMRWLSMGMSHDFAVAVQEGSTLVRIGTALFGPRRP